MSPIRIRRSNGQRRPSDYAWKVSVCLLSASTWAFPHPRVAREPLQNPPPGFHPRIMESQACDLADRKQQLKKRLFPRTNQKHRSERSRISRARLRRNLRATLTLTARLVLPTGIIQMYSSMSSYQSTRIGQAGWNSYTARPPITLVTAVTYPHLTPAVDGPQELIRQ